VPDVPVFYFINRHEILFLPWSTETLGLTPQTQLQIKISVERSLVFRVVNMWIYFRFCLVTLCCSGLIFRRFRNVASLRSEFEIFLQVNIERLDGKITQNALYLFKNTTDNCFLPAAGFILFSSKLWTFSPSDDPHSVYVGGSRALNNCYVLSQR
jgi:hypothetical protein